MPTQTTEHTSKKVSVTSVHAAASCDDQPLAVSTEDGLPQLSYRRILVVDDCESNRLLARAILELAECEVFTARNGLESLRVCEEANPELVPLDLQIPEPDGREVTRRVRFGTLCCKNVPIIGLTADVDDELRQRCLEAGMNEVISKPIDPDLLLTTVDVWLDRSPRSSSGGDHEDALVKTIATEHNEAITAPDDSVKPFDYDLALAGFVGNEVLLNGAIKSFLATLAKKIIELHRTIPNRDENALCQITHNLRGRARNLTADRFADSLVNLESVAKRQAWHSLDTPLNEVETEARLLKKSIAEQRVARSHTWKLHSKTQVDK